MAKKIVKYDALTGKKSAGKVKREEVEADVSDNRYTHEQSSPAFTWNVTHNLNKRCSVTITDLYGNLEHGTVSYINNNSLTVTFGSLEVGFVYCN